MSDILNTENTIYIILLPTKHHVATVIDNEFTEKPPVINLRGDPSVSIEVGQNYSDLGAFALDKADGDISDRIQIVNPVNTNVPDTYTITYNVTDSAGLAADQVTRTVTVVDTTPPVITLRGSSYVFYFSRNCFDDPGATAFDNFDGDISDRIQIVNPVNTNVPDTYTITYNVTDSANLPAEEVTVPLLL